MEGMVWQGVTHNLMGLNYLHLDSSELNQGCKKFRTMLMVLKKNHSLDDMIIWI